MIRLTRDLTCFGLRSDYYCTEVPFPRRTPGLRPGELITLRPLINRRTLTVIQKRYHFRGRRQGCDQSASRPSSGGGSHLNSNLASIIPINNQSKFKSGLNEQLPQKSSSIPQVSRSTRWKSTPKISWK